MLQTGRTPDLTISRDTKREMQFQDSESGAKVKVRITDKEPLETALGVDLLIYQSLYNSLIFVQYKAMEKSAQDGWFYRPDAQLKLQLNAMGAARKAMRKRAVNVPTLEGQRLNDEPFYFKLCERRKPDAAEASLVQGLSMNAIHLEEFLEMPQAKSGPKEGIRIGYKNCHRYFNKAMSQLIVELYPYPALQTKQRGETRHHEPGLSSFASQDNWPGYE